MASADDFSNLNEICRAGLLAEQQRLLDGGVELQVIHDFKNPEVLKHAVSLYVACREFEMMQNRRSFYGYREECYCGRDHELIRRTANMLRLIHKMVMLVLESCRAVLAKAALQQVSIWQSSQHNNQHPHERLVEKIRQAVKPRASEHISVKREKINLKLASELTDIKVYNMWKKSINISTRRPKYHYCSNHFRCHPKFIHR
jgi:hypothetical protein